VLASPNGLTDAFLILGALSAMVQADTGWGDERWLTHEQIGPWHQTLLDTLAREELGLDPKDDVRDRGRFGVE